MPKDELNADRLRSQACTGEAGIKLNCMSQQTDNRALFSSFQTPNLNHHTTLLIMASKKIINQKEKPCEEQQKLPRSLSGCVLYTDWITLLLYVESTNSFPLWRSSPGWYWFLSHQTWLRVLASGLILAVQYASVNSTVQRNLAWP